jgi:putative chitinase
MAITPQQLMAAIGCPFDLASRWAPVLSAAMDRFSINTPARQAHFLAQIAHESAGLTALAENLNYSADRLLRIFPAKFKPSEAEAFARKPAAIANRVYANRFGNGPESSGDGWRYRGRGLIQMTFRNNYRAAGEAMGIDLENNPDLLLVPRNAAFSAAWFWRIGAGLRLSKAALAHGLKDGCDLNDLADKGDLAGITLAINGGLNGLAERTALFQRASKALA